MKSFKAICVQDNKKIDFVLSWESKEEVRLKLHSQWYSVIEVIEIESSSINTDGFFYFEIISENWDIKKWQIKSNDIFKAYIKLVEDLKYNVLYIYEKKDTELEEKKITTWKIKESYELYNKKNPSQNTKEKEEENIRKKLEEQKKAKNNEEELAITDKRIIKSYALIDKIIDKINNLKESFRDFITPENLFKLNELVGLLKQLKNITNVEQIKLKCQSYVLEVWKIELEILEQDKNLAKYNLTRETNKLLSNLWASKKIKDDSDISYKIKFFIEDFKNKFKKNKNLDKTSYTYLKALRELNIYKKKLNSEKINILKSILTFNKEKLKIAKLRQKTILQNMEILKSRIYWKKVSYTKIVKWMKYYNDVFVYFINQIGNIFTYIVFIYSLFFILYSILYNFFPDIFKFNNNIILLISFISFLGLLLKLSKNVLIFVIFIFLYINFFIYFKINF